MENINPADMISPLKGQITDRTTPRSKLEREQLRLKEACQDFEGVFISILLKEGMKPGQNSDAESTVESGMMMQEFAIEQCAKEMGRNGTVGLADVLYEQLSQTLQKPKEDTISILEEE